MTEPIDPLDAVRHRRAPEPRVVDASHTPIDGVRREAWLRKALDDETAILAATPEGARNHRLNKVAFTLGGHTGPGRLAEDDVVAGLWVAGREVGLDDTEIAKILPRAVREGAERPFPLPDLDDDEPLPLLRSLGAIPGLLGSGGAGGEHPTAGGAGVGAGVGVGAAADAGVDAADRHVEFWAARPVLKHVYDYAKARRVNPWALLGVLMARVTTVTPWTIVLPPVIGARASLNLFVGLVGPSGSGKSVALGVARDAMDVGIVHTVKLGSGEGIAHTYRKRERSGEEVWRRQAALFEMAEVDALSALGNRQGSTLLPELRSGWSGEQLGFGYADPAKRLLVPAHQYRLCLVVGIQPGRAKPLLGDVDAGTPQRFLWLPAPDAAALRSMPPPPGIRMWHPPSWGRLTSGWERSADGWSYLPVCETARRAVDDASFDRATGAADALDGHAVLAREKVAACLALLDERAEIADEDWELAGVVMRVSDRTREGVSQVLRATERQADEASAKRAAARATVIDSEVEKKALPRVTANLMRYLERLHPEFVSGSDLRRDALGSKDRPYFEQVIDGLVQTGQVEAERVKKGLHYRTRK